MPTHPANPAPLAHPANLANPANHARPGDHAVVARLTETSRRHARRAALTPDQHLAAATELADSAAGRADLLAQCAGLAAGAHAGDPDEAVYLRAAQLCIDAGADQSQIPRWTREARPRAAPAR
jgi:hypothetical protein